MCYLSPPQPAVILASLPAVCLPMLFFFFFLHSSFFFFFSSRITDIYDKIPMTVAGVVGYLESASPYQVFLKNDPEAAKTLLPEMEKR